MTTSVDTRIKPFGAQDLVHLGDQFLDPGRIRRHHHYVGEAVPAELGSIGRDRDHRMIRFHPAVITHHHLGNDHPDHGIRRLVQQDLAPYRVVLAEQIDGQFVSQKD